jgi:DNA-binding NtrC family response regulator
MSLGFGSLPGPWHWLCKKSKGTFHLYEDGETMNARLLVVEDDPEMRDLLRKVLEKEGCRVSVAGDGRAATASLSRHPFDLVVTDMLMPDDGGLELLQDIRKSQPTLPVIIITAFGDWGTYSRALELGAAAFISKPLKMAELIAAIHAALAGRGAGQAV